MRKTTWILITTLIGGHLIVDLIVPQLFFLELVGEWLLASMLGLCIGQINLIGVWAAMAPGRVVLRLPWSIFLATLMWYALVIGNRMQRFSSPEYYYGAFRSEEALQLGLILLVAVILVQLPLWAASRVFRWRLIPPKRNDKDHESLDERQFNIKHIIISMTIVSVALGLGRLVLPPSEGDVTVTSLDRELTVLLPVIAGVNLIVVVPCIWGAFARLPYVLPLVTGWIFYALVVTAVEVVALSAVLRPPPGHVWLAMYLFNISQCLALFGTLACLRGIGFRLVQLTKKNHKPGQRIS